MGADILPSGPMPSALTQFTEEDVRCVLRNSLKWSGVIIVAALPVLWIWQGWQTWLLFVVGAAVSATGVFEWLQLLSAMMARMDEGHTPSPMGRVLIMFFLRLALAGVVLYASLNSLHGSMFALLAGLGLSLCLVLAESVRLMART
jgi:hypothetical protein